MPCKICIVKTFLKLYKTINEPIPCNVADLFYSKSTPRGIGHSRVTPTALWHLRHSCTRRALGHSGTWALEALYLADSLQAPKMKLFTKMVNDIKPLITILVISCLVDVWQCS